MWNFLQVILWLRRSECCDCFYSIRTLNFECDHIVMISPLSIVFYVVVLMIAVTTSAIYCFLFFISILYRIAKYRRFFFSIHCSIVFCDTAERGNQCTYCAYSEFFSFCCSLSVVLFLFFAFCCSLFVLRFLYFSFCSSVSSSFSLAHCQNIPSLVLLFFIYFIILSCLLRFSGWTVHNLFIIILWSSSDKSEDIQSSWLSL